MKKQQQGGTILGFILGLVVGLGAALGVAVYVSKVPVPFVDKAGLRGAGQDELEAAKNKNWDPNSPLYGKNPAPTNAPAASGVVGADSPEPDTAPALVGDKDAKDAKETKDAKATKEAKDSKDAKATKDAKDAKEAKEAARAGDPLGDLAKAKTNASASDNTDPFTYFVQAGAFRTQADAEAQRAKLAIQGWEARVSEREQSGRTVFRVRIGPFDKRADADQIRNKLDALKVESNLVRVQR